MKKTSGLLFFLLLIFCYSCLAASFVLVSGKFGYRITLPMEWEMFNKENGKMVGVSQGDSLIFVLVQNINPKNEFSKIGIGAMTDKELAEFVKDISPYVLEKYERTFLNGETAVAIYSHRNIPDSDDIYKLWQVYTIKNGKLYCVVCCALNSEFAKCEELFNTAINSFEFFTPKT